MKRYLLLAAMLALAGCAAPQERLANRRQERLAAYQALPPDLRAVVDTGRLKTGMNEDAVYIAWGRPDQVLQRGSAAGEETVWLYEGSYLAETRYWGRRHLHSAYVSAGYVRAEVVFAQGLVTSWRTLAAPPY